MQGVPRYGLRTRADYDLLLSLSAQDEIRPQGLATLKRHLNGLLAGRFTYVYDRDLVDGESPDGDMPDYRVLSVEDEEVGTTRRVQMQRIESPQAEIFRLGFTVQEVEQAITDLEAV